MAKIVLGIGSSHGPMLVTETDIWDARVPFDKVVRHAWRNGSYSFDELVTARKDENLGRMVSKQVWDEQQVRCHCRCQDRCRGCHRQRPDGDI